MSEAAPPPTEDNANRDLVLRFESLGGRGHGCEFGIFQRGQGAEPLGLLRWADLEQTALIAALNDRFAGVGEPEHTEIFVPSNAEEYWTRDRRYWMAMRTFIRTAEIPPERAEGLILNRLRFLRRKLIEDLEAGEKIFVFKNMMRDLYPHELAALHRAVRSYGDGVLLYLRFADASAPDGSVRAVSRGLLVGAVAHFSFSPEDKPLGEPTESFLAVCREAVRLRDAPEVWNGLPDLLDAPDPDAMQREGLERLHRGDHAGAEAALRAALKVRDSAAVRVALAEALAAQGRAAEATAEAAAAAELAEIDPDATHPVALLRLGEGLMRAGQYAVAEGLLRRAASRAPDDVAVLDRLADTEERLGRPADALASAQRAAALTPTDPGRALRVARALLGANQPAAAEQVALTLVDHPDVPQAHVRHILGIALEWQGRVSDALAQARLALAADPNNPGALERVARLLVRMGQTEEAAEMLTEALRGEWRENQALSTLLSSITVPTPKPKSHRARGRLSARWLGGTALSRPLRDLIGRGEPSA